MHCKKSIALTGNRHKTVTLLCLGTTVMKWVLAQKQRWASSALCHIYSHRCSSHSWVWQPQLSVAPGARAGTSLVFSHWWPRWIQVSPKWPYGLKRKYLNWGGVEQRSEAWVETREAFPLIFLTTSSLIILFRFEKGEDYVYEYRISSRWPIAILNLVPEMTPYGQTWMESSHWRNIFLRS